METLHFSKPSSVFHHFKIKKISKNGIWTRAVYAKRPDETSRLKRPDVVHYTIRWLVYSLDNNLLANEWKPDLFYDLRQADDI